MAEPPEPCEPADPVLPDLKQPVGEVPEPYEPVDPVLPDGVEPQPPAEIPGFSDSAVPVRPGTGELPDPALRDEAVAQAEDSTVRHSTRTTAGQHSNPNREPRSAVNNSVTISAKDFSLTLFC